MTAAETQEISKLTVLMAKPASRIMALETAHTSGSPFDAAMDLLKTVDAA